MRPPVMTEEQTEIYNAAKQIIGDDVIFKYPLAQGTHSAFVFYDVDGDQQEEAIVFYQKETDANVRDEPVGSGGWRMVFNRRL